MKLVNSTLLEVLIVEPKVFGDDRGYFYDVVVDIRRGSPTFEAEIFP